MSKTEVTNAITIPEDEGTGVPTDSADWISAGHIAGLHAQSNTTDYVENGLSMSVDTSTDSPVVTVGGGLVFLYSDSSVRVQNSSGQYNNDWNHGVTYAIHIGSNDIELTSGELNHVYLELDLQNNNRCFYTILTGTSPSPPSVPHLRVGLVDLTVADPSTETVNRLPNTEVAQTHVRQPPTKDDHVVRQTDLDSALDSSLPIHDNNHHSPTYATEEALNTHTSANNPHSVTAEDVGALADSTGSVTEDNLNFDSATQSELSDAIADFIEGVVISDDGTSVLTTADINFGTGLSVVDDGDGTVTIDGSDSGSYTDEQAQDAVNAMLVGSDNVSLSYDDENNALTISSTNTQIDPSTIGATDLGFDTATQDELNTHTNATNNPHSVTPSEISALPTSGGSMSGNIDMGANRIIADVTDGQLIQAAVGADAFTQFARYSLDGYGDIAWGPNNENARGNALTIYDYAQSEYVFSVELNGEGTTVEQGDLNVSNGDINTSNEVSGGTVTADSSMNIPVYNGSDPDNGNIWIREDL